MKKLRYAIIALVWINKAFACGVIQEGQGSAKKIEDLQKKNEQLQKDLEQLSSDYIRLRAFTDQFIKYVKLPSESESGDENERKSP